METVKVKRLISLCGMFGSNNENERAQAAMHATNLIAKAGKTWEEVIKNGLGSDAQPRRTYRADAQKPSSAYNDYRQRGPGNTRKMYFEGVEAEALMAVLQHYIASTDYLTRTEINFVRGLQDQDCGHIGLTLKQWRWALSIVNRVQNSAYT